MLPKHNLFDAVTLACLPDPLPRLRRALFKRLGSNTTDFQRLAVLYMWRPYSSTVPLVVLLATCGGLAFLISWVLDLLSIREAIRLGAAVGWFMAIPILWINFNRMRIFIRLGGRVRLAGIPVGGPDPIEIQTRRRDWLAFLTSRDGYAVRWVAYEASGLVVIGTTAVCMLLAGIELTQLLFKGSIAGVISPLMPVLIVVLIIRKAPPATRIRERLITALEHRRCPACSYDLSTHPLAADDGAGPPRCPECGTRWPLVPPPLFEKPGTDPVLPAHVPHLKVLMKQPESGRELTRR